MSPFKRTLYSQKMPEFYGKSPVERDVHLVRRACIVWEEPSQKSPLSQEPCILKKAPLFCCHSPVERDLHLIKIGCILWEEPSPKIYPRNLYAV